MTKPTDDRLLRAADAVCKEIAEFDRLVDSETFDELWNAVEAAKLEAAARPSPAEPVAYRWRYRTDPAWHFALGQPPDAVLEFADAGTMAVEPLYLAAPSAQPSQSTVEAALTDQVIDDWIVTLTDRSCIGPNLSGRAKLHEFARAIERAVLAAPVAQMHRNLVAPAEKADFLVADEEIRAQDESHYCENCLVLQSKLDAVAQREPGEGWISVEDRLPEFGGGAGYVMVAMSSGLVEKTFYCVDDGYHKVFCAPDPISNRFEHAAKYGYTVTHWMTLPAAPIAGASDDH